jgi:hypothetical protein
METTTGLILREADALMPVITIEDATERYRAIVEYVSKLMKEGTDFGKIPGTDKKTLLKPGAEKLCTFFGLSKRFELLQSIEDWNGADHGGESFFYYRYRCGLSRGDLPVAEAEGSCNSRESKYRWRKGERKCPDCGSESIIKRKAEYGGGWLCLTKKGGCGAKFGDRDERITNQQPGRVLNPDICDLVNTIQKMAQKRAFNGATLLAVNASEFFSEDFTPNTSEAPARVKPDIPKETAERVRPQDGVPAPETSGWLVTRRVKMKILNLWARALEVGIGESELRAVLGQYGCESRKELAPEQAPDFVSELSRLINEVLEQERREKNGGGV